MKIFTTILAETLSALVLFASIAPQLAYAQASCSNFSSASYAITNNGGNTNFSVGDTIETGLTLRARPGTSTGAADIVLVMDRTGSMGTPIEKIIAAKQALRDAVATIRDSGNPHIRVSLVVYNSSAQVLQSLTRNFSAVEVAIDSMTPEGRTSIGAGLLAAAGELNAHANPGVNKFIILASDGNQNTPPEIADGLAQISMDTTIYTVGIGKIGTGGEAALDEAVMSAIAAARGNQEMRYYSADAGNMTAVYQKIIDSIFNLLSLQDVSITFTRDNMRNVNFSSADPRETSYDATNGIIRWNNIGDVSTSMSNIVGINYSARRFGSNVVLNTNTLTAQYVISGMSCVETVPVNVLDVDIYPSEPPPIVNLVINPPTIYKEDTAVVNWTVTGTTESCVAANGSPGWAGDKDFPSGNQRVGPFVPPQSIDYSLQCFGPGGSSPVVTRTLTVTPPVDGVCGPARDVATRTEPLRANLCSVGTPSLVTKNNIAKQWEWSCRGVYKGESPFCSAPIKWKVLIWEF
jgi:hypothetical protein